jgi:hypothetical protein
MRKAAGLLALTSLLACGSAKATVAPGSPDITYDVGDLVMFDAQMYRCVQKNSGLAPPSHPEAWSKLPTPADDLRVRAGSPYAAFGVH